MTHKQRLLATTLALLQRDVNGGPLNLNDRPKRHNLRDDKARIAKAEAKRQRRLARNKAMAALEKGDE